MFTPRKSIIHVLMVSTILLLFACNHVSRQKDVTVVEADTVRQIELLPFPKDSVLIGIKWFWVVSFNAEYIEERFALNLQNRSETPVMLD